MGFTQHAATWHLYILTNYLVAVMSVLTVRWSVLFNSKELQNQWSDRLTEGKSPRNGVYWWYFYMFDICSFQQLPVFTESEIVGLLSLCFLRAKEVKGRRMHFIFFSLLFSSFIISVVALTYSFQACNFTRFIYSTLENHVESLWLSLQNLGWASLFWERVLIPLLSFPQIYTKPTFTHLVWS